MNVREIYEGSNGDATQRLYNHLRTLGPAGVVAENLFRASKCSARAKIYKRRRHKTDAYGRKNWSIQNLSGVLQIHAEALGIVWGWKEDPAQSFHNWVLYIELPGIGQVSYHAERPISKQRFAGEWDGYRNSAQRVLLYVERVLKPVESEVAA